jgi:pyrroloquinoline quinone biosynthesis protein E
MTNLRRLIWLLRWNAARPGRMLNAVQNRLGLRRRPDRPGYMPIALDIEPTARCNLRCPMCQLSTWERNPRDMTLERFRKLLDRFPSVMKIKLQGIGEPLLNREFFAMVEEAAGRGIAVETTTNGTLLSERNCRRLLDSGLTAIFLSVDGATAETFERIRRGAKFGRVMEGIRRLTAMRGRRRLPGIHLWTVGQAGNIHEAPDLVRLAKDLGVDSLRLQYDLIFWGQEEWQAKLEPDSLRTAVHRRAAETFIEEARMLAGQLGIRFVLYTDNKFSWKAGKLCPWPWSSAFISSEGDMVPCCVIGNPDVFSFGNVLKEEVSTLWNGEAYQEFRRAMKRGNIPSVCKGCYTDGGH